MLPRLLDAGAEIRPTGADTHTLRRAVQVEHTAMVGLLLDKGVGSDRGRALALKMARDMGLDSMADLLRSRGATLASLPKPLPGRA